MAYELKKIKVLGYTTDFGQCECCGKDNLRGTISILDIESGVILHFGTTCAAKADKYDTLEAFNEAKKEINKVKREVEERKRFAWKMVHKFKIDLSKIDKVADDFIKFMSIPENRLKRFNWESYI